MASVKELQAQKDKNSTAWHSAATQEEKDRLHQANVELQKEIDRMTGGSSSFDSKTGKWTTSGGTSSSSSSSSKQHAIWEDDDDDDSYSPSSSSSTSSSTGSGYKPYVQGQNAALDRELAVWSQRYNEAKERALAGDMSAVMDMRNANDEANKLRNAYGYAAVFANEDINNVKKQINYYGGGSSSGGSSGGGVPSPSPSGSENMYMDGNGTVVEDLSAYLEELYAAQRRQTLANLDNAYQQNVNAINRAGEGVDARYQNARNQAAGASELAARNFAEYAAASGLNSGAGGQAELARNVTLQNNLNDINSAEADVYADLELQLANAETEYNNAIAQAEASNDFALAESLYQEKIRVQQELVNQQMQQYQMDLQNRQLAFQQQQAEIANQQWQQQFDYNSQQDAKSNLAAWGEISLQYGKMPSQEMLDAMGMSADYAQSLIASMQAAAAEDSRLKYQSSNSSSSQSKNMYQYLHDQGVTTYEDAYMMLLGQGYSNTEAENLAGYYVDMLKNGKFGGGGDEEKDNDNPLTSIPAYILNNISRLEDTANATNKILTAISGYVNSGAITEDQARELGRKYGLEL